MSRMDEILAFWFGGLEPGAAPPPEYHRLWFGGGEADRLIRERFGDDLVRAVRGEYDAWGDTPRGRLALILLFDQFPRNIHRGTAQAYGCDGRAVGLALEGRARGHDRLLAVVERAFFYLPLEHAEDLSLQLRAVAAFTELLATAPPALRETCRGFLDYAERHLRIIERFGRFPHRNAALGRSSTLEEEAFLREPGSSF